MTLVDDVLWQFEGIQDDFLTAMVGGTSSTQVFAQRFAQLHSYLPTDCSEQKYSVALKAASNISLIAESLLEVEIRANGFFNELQDDIAGLFSSMTLDNTYPPLSHSPTPSTPSLVESLPPTKHQCDLSVSSIDESDAHQASYTWLLSHLSNPYPAASTKARLAAHAGLTPKALADWFANARRRIGWSVLCKRRFANDRCAMIDAAQRILSEDTQPPRLPFSKEIIDEFRRVKECAERLYDGKIAQSELATKLGASIDSIPAAVSKKRKARSPSSTTSSLPTKKATLARHASGVSTASSATLFDFDAYNHTSAPSRKRGAASVWEEETLTDSDAEPQQGRSRFKRRRESTSSSASGPSRQPTLITSASSPSGASTPAPTTPIFAPASLSFGPASQATSSQTGHLHTLIDDWLASVKADSPACTADELPPASSSRKRRSAEQEEGENRRRAKKARVVSGESEVFESGSSAFWASPAAEGYSCYNNAVGAAAEGLYPPLALQSFPMTFPSSNETNAESLYGLDFAPQAPSLASDLLLGNEFGAFEGGSLDFGLGLGLGGEEQALEVGVGAYGFDLTTGAGTDFGFGSLPDVGLEVGAGADLASVLQQLHPGSEQQLQQQFDLFSAVAPETVALPEQGAEEVEKLTVTLSEEDMAALAGCLEGDAFGPRLTERDVKLSRLQSLLAEVTQLHQEVFS